MDRMKPDSCMKGALDDSMKEYNLSDACMERRHEINHMISTLRITLSPEQSRQLNRLLKAIDRDDSLFASEAYMHGVVEGIALRNKYVMNL